MAAETAATGIGTETAIATGEATAHAQETGGATGEVDSEIDRARRIGVAGEEEEEVVVVAVGEVAVVGTEAVIATMTGTVATGAATTKRIGIAVGEEGTKTFMNAEVDLPPSPFPFPFPLVYTLDF